MSILQPEKQLEFLGLQIITEEMTLSLSEEKLAHTIHQCQEVYSQPRNSVSRLTRQVNYSGYVILGNLARQELLWWIENIRLSNGRKIQQQEPLMTIQPCFHERVGSTFRWNLERVLKKEQGHHINVLRLIAVKFAILTFTKNLSNLKLFISRSTTKSHYRIS